MKKRLAVMLAAMSLAAASSASAATVFNAQGTAFGVDDILTTSYKVSYEVYNNSAGATTIAGSGGSYGQLNINLTQPLIAGQNVNIRVSNGTAVFNSAGSGNNRYGLCDLGPVLTNSTAGIEACTPGNIIAVMPPSGVTTDNLGLQVTIPAGVPAGNYIRLVQWNDVNDNGQYDAGEAFTEGASLFVAPGLNASCTFTPIVKMTVSTSGGESTAKPFNFAYITPQFVFTGPSSSALNAELDTDKDFKQFVLGSGDAPPATLTTTLITQPSFFSVTSIAPFNLTTESGWTVSRWINYASLSPAGDITYKLNSAATEPGINAGNIVADLSACTADSTGKTWICSKTGVNLAAAHSLTVAIDGIGENNPTNWSITDFNMSVTTSGVNSLCTVVPGPGVGSWYGGIEAIVPFVKSIDGNYATYIKLYNRYTKAAKVYIADMNQITDSIVTSITQLPAPNDAIPSKGFITIDGPTLKAGGILNDTELTNGAPIKFLIRVPAQMSSTPFTTFADPLLGTAAGVARVSVVDPYITGIVVQTTPNGSQRSIPLTFKAFKQGQYN